MSMVSGGSKSFRGYRRTRRTVNSRGSSFRFRSLRYRGIQKIPRPPHHSPGILKIEIFNAKLSKEEILGKDSKRSLEQTLVSSLFPFVP